MAFPRLIEKAIERIDRLNLAGLPAIRCLRDSQRRTEACEALRAVMRATMQRTDIASMTIGIRDAAGRWSATGSGIAGLTKLAGFHRKPRKECARGTAAEYRRTQRALETLGPGTGKHAKQLRPGAGLIVTEQRRERGDVIGGAWVADKRGREFRSRNAVRRVTPIFWRILGLEIEAKAQRRWHVDRLRERQPRAASLAASTLEHIASVTGRARRRGPVYTAVPVEARPGAAPPPISNVAQDWQELARFRALYDDLKREHPTWPPGDLAGRADETLEAERRAPVAAPDCPPT